MGVSKCYAGLHTLVMIPTIDDVNNDQLHRDFDPLTFATNGAIGTFNGPMIIAENHGGVTPPPFCPTGDPGDSSISVSSGGIIQSGSASPYYGTDFMTLSDK
jgi:hypothetical protein